MGTKEEVAGLQAEIRALIARLGWTQNQFARELYVEFYETENDDEIIAFQERVKKALQRKTTKPERLREYLSIISRHPDVTKLGLIQNHYVPSGYISDYLSKGLTMISKELDRQISSEESRKSE